MVFLMEQRRLTMHFQVKKHPILILVVIVLVTLDVWALGRAVAGRESKNEEEFIRSLKERNPALELQNYPRSFRNGGCLISPMHHRKL
jgi:hypothetical protein